MGGEEKGIPVATDDILKSPEELRNFYNSFSEENTRKLFSTFLTTRNYFPAGDIGLLVVIPVSSDDSSRS